MFTIEVDFTMIPSHILTCKTSISCSLGLWHVTFSKEVICFSFNLFVYLWPSTILQACILWIKSDLKFWLIDSAMTDCTHLHRKIICLLLISYLKARKMRILNCKPIHFLEVFNHRFHIHLIINWETVEIAESEL